MVNLEKLATFDTQNTRRRQKKTKTKTQHNMCLGTPIHKQTQIRHEPSYKQQKLLTLHEHLSSSPVFWWSVFFSIFKVFVLSYYMYLRSEFHVVIDVRYDFSIYTMLGSSLPPVVCRGGSRHIYVICVCLRIVVSNTYCGVLFVLFSSSCVPYVDSSSGLSIFSCPFGIL
jgi:hypothetical protein